MKNKKTDEKRMINLMENELEISAIKMAEREIKEWTMFLKKVKIRLAKNLNKK